MDVVIVRAGDSLNLENKDTVLCWGDTMLLIRPIAKKAAELLLAALILLIGGPISLDAWTPQKGQPPVPTDPDSSQRIQQMDRMEQQQQQNARDQSTINAQDEIRREEARQQEDAQYRARLQQMMRENFRRHFQVLRDNAAHLTEITEALRFYVDSHYEPGLPRDLQAKAALMEKLAHQIRVTLSSRHLPRLTASTARAMAGAVKPPFSIATHEVLLEEVNGSVSMSAALNQGVEQYLSTQNEQAVSVDALKRVADKTQIDPSLLQIMRASWQLEQYGYDLRARTRLVPRSSASSPRQ